MISLTDLIGDKGDILWWQMSLRAAVVLVFGIVLIRLIGRRAFAQQNPLDIIVAIVTGSNLSRALTGNAPLFATLAATLALVVMVRFLDIVTARWRLFGGLVKGQAVSLVRDRQFQPGAMRLWGVSKGDIAEAARASGLPGIEKVKDAFLERSGKISTIAES